MYNDCGQSLAYVQSNTKKNIFMVDKPSVAWSCGRVTERQIQVGENFIWTTLRLKG